ncbi:hypothetical protein VFPFJ_11695 [Purpureocillium lilacinum]|uniref:Uncharacterized protein n=1 Tax=Purpureocillium lilacinum TaxID=33203 RepID=A0A179EXR7_PURLI|nr:hypothetical protein VFPFJ_11695 [Purpureocillium lilacinum]OAQ57985.1 hypothetical protein VFPFJ_11695 [Purpureocillium lilacinum]
MTQSHRRAQQWDIGRNKIRAPGIKTTTVGKISPNRAPLDLTHASPALSPGLHDTGHVMDGHAAARWQAPRTRQGNKGWQLLDGPNHFLKEAPLPTVSITPLPDTEPERVAPRSYPRHHGLPQTSHQSRRQPACPNPNHSPDENSLYSGQRPSKRVRFLEPPTHRSHPDNTGPAEARAQRHVENQHHRPGTAAPSQLPRSTGQAALHIAEVQHLNRVCASPGTFHNNAGVEDVKIWNGIKYERRTKGPFVGRFASRGAIINIDGEEYVEYRVLTKPSFL